MAKQVRFGLQVKRAFAENEDCHVREEGRVVEIARTTTKAGAVWQQMVLDTLKAAGIQADTKLVERPIPGRLYGKFIIEVREQA